jgi:hypothetical protein
MEFKVPMVINMYEFVCKNIAKKQLSIYDPDVLDFMGTQST